jgi:hypothetical protein
VHDADAKLTELLVSGSVALTAPTVMAMLGRR